MNENTPAYYPPLLLESLGGGKRPIKTVKITNIQVSKTPPSNIQKPRQLRSRSRERSLTPGIYGSPSSANLPLDEDAPPTTMLYSSSPTKRATPKLNLSTHSTPAQTPQTPHTPGSHMSVDNLNTPVSILNGTTITVIGIPPHRHEFIKKMFTELGPVAYINLQEGKNYMVVTYLHSSSVEAAMRYDGKTFDDSWVIVVRIGDLFNTHLGKDSEQKSISSERKDSFVSSERKSEVGTEKKLGLESPSAYMETPSKLKPKRSLILTEASLMTPAKPVKPILKETRTQNYPTIHEDPVSFVHPQQFQSEPNENLYPTMEPVQQERNEHRQVTLNMKSSGIFERITDLIFGW
ncbi:hypothetical protein HDV06_005911 [Boothiomyces sp. JEL0866]|nr:hypothetical protein HDV06_005911 [Boothiomyces sp. JEL0866]